MNIGKISMVCDFRLLLNLLRERRFRLFLDSLKENAAKIYIASKLKMKNNLIFLGKRVLARKYGIPIVVIISLAFIYFLERLIPVLRLQGEFLFQLF